MKERRLPVFKWWYNKGKYEKLGFILLIFILLGLLLICKIYLPSFIEMLLYLVAIFAGIFVVIGSIIGIGYLITGEADKAAAKKVAKKAKKE